MNLQVLQLHMLMVSKAVYCGWGSPTPPNQAVTPSMGRRNLIPAHSEILMDSPDENEILAFASVMGDSGDEVDVDLAAFLQQKVVVMMVKMDHITVVSVRRLRL